MVLGGLGLWLMSGEIYSLAMIGAFLVPLAGSSTETLIPAIAGDRVPKNLRSRALGLINTAGDLGATIGPFAALSSLNSGWFSLGEIYKIAGGLFAIVAVLAFSPLVWRQATVAEVYALNLAVLSSFLCASIFRTLYFIIPAASSNIPLRSSLFWLSISCTLP